MIRATLCLAAALLGAALPAAHAQEPFVGELRWVPYNFAPRGWASCNGQILPIAQNQALFSLLGTTYGGNGQTTFALPDLRGRMPIHFGQGPGLSNRDLGEVGGAESVTLLVTEMPAHTHALQASTALAPRFNPTGSVLGRPAEYTGSGYVASETRIYRAAEPNTTLAPAAVGTTGGSQAHANMPPYTGMHCIIAMTGIFPARD